MGLLLGRGRRRVVLSAVGGRSPHLLLPLCGVLLVEEVEGLRPGAVDVEPPVADEKFLVEE